MANKLEEQLDELLVKKAPFQIPENGRKTIAEWLPWISLILGALTLWSAWVLWEWAHVANVWSNYANELSAALGGGKVVEQRLSVMVWVALAVVAVEGVLFLASFSGTKARKKSGWNLLFYAALLNIVYGVVTLFTNYNGVSNLIWTVISAVIGLYFLFQIRSQYTGVSKTE